MLQFRAKKMSQLKQNISQVCPLQDSQLGLHSKQADFETFRPTMLQLVLQILFQQGTSSETSYGSHLSSSQLIPQSLHEVFAFIAAISTASERGLIFPVVIF